MSVNALRIEQIDLLCRHVIEALQHGINENTAIRSLEQAVDATARFHKMGHAKPVKVHDIPTERWSRAARLAFEQHLGRRPGDFLRIEHGTPKRELARRVLELSRTQNLNENTWERLIAQHWKLAVITKDEDKRLPRSEMMSTPEQRWSIAGIEF